jgi:hypothetical protein
MTIKKIKLFGWREGWPWWLVLAIDTVATVQAVNYNYLTTKEGISFGGWVALISVIVAFYSVTTWRYILRALYQLDHWVYFTRSCLNPVESRYLQRNWGIFDSKDSKLC